MKLAGAGLATTGMAAFSAVAIVALGAGLTGAKASTAKPATFEMYANVDAEADLGSHVGATSVTYNGVYIVTFNKPIGHCAAVVQSGKAGGSDMPKFDTSIVEPNNVGAAPDPIHQLLVEFIGAGSDTDTTPFMLTVTCPS